MDLLDSICQQLGFAFISDMRGKVTPNQFALVLRSTDPESYTLAEWQEAVRYIFNEELLEGKQLSTKVALWQYFKVES
ncbi:MAG: hypothetical protein RSD70_01320 [Acidaminococcaceae bacterium]